MGWWASFHAAGDAHEMGDTGIPGCGGDSNMIQHIETRTTKQNTENYNSNINKTIPTSTAKQASQLANIKGNLRQSSNISQSTQQNPKSKNRPMKT